MLRPTNHSDHSLTNKALYNEYRRVLAKYMRVNAELMRLKSQVVHLDEMLRRRALGLDDQSAPS